MYFRFTSFFFFHIFFTQSYGTITFYYFIRKNIYVTVAMFCFVLFYLYK